MQRGEEWCSGAVDSLLLVSPPAPYSFAPTSLPPSPFSCPCTRVCVCVCAQEDAEDCSSCGVYDLSPHGPSVDPFRLSPVFHLPRITRARILSGHLWPSRARPLSSVGPPRCILHFRCKVFCCCSTDSSLSHTRTHRYTDLSISSRGSGEDEVLPLGGSRAGFAWVNHLGRALPRTSRQCATCCTHTHTDCGCGYTTPSFPSPQDRRALASSCVTHHGIHRQ